MGGSIYKRKDEEVKEKQKRGPYIMARNPNPNTRLKVNSYHRNNKESPNT